jgi:hypothetical protein
VSVAVTLNNAFDFVQQAAGLADIFNETSLFPEMPWPATAAQKPNAALPATQWARAASLCDA